MVSATAAARVARPSTLGASTFTRVVCHQQAPCTARSIIESTRSPFFNFSQQQHKCQRIKVPTRTVAFSTSALRGRQFKTVEQAKAFNRMGPVSLWSGLFFVLCGGGLVYYFSAEKARLARKRTREASKGYGKARIGGDFQLVDQDGKPFSSEDMKGKFALLYFGFTNCPDICPDELDKMAKMIDLVRDKRGNVLKPIFITCDPNRDSPAIIKSYLKEFHSSIIGLTGTWEQVKAMCKAYRVYFSTPPHAKPGQDYLVDHSIYFYLMDPEGEFIEVIGREHTAERGAKLVTDHIGDWDGHIDKS